MKNDSPLFPLPRLDDFWYDADGDNKLTGLETIVRDADLLTKQQKEEEERKKKQQQQRYGYVKRW